MTEQTHPEAGVEQGLQGEVERMSAALFHSEEPAKEEPTQETAQPEQQQAEPSPVETEPTPEDIQDEAPVEQPVDAFELEIVHDGRQVKLNREDTIKLARQGYDYTQKTQALAKDRQQVQEHLQRLAQIEQQVSPQLQGQLAQVKALETQLQQYNGVNWVQLAQQDAGLYAQHRAQYDTLRDAYGNAVNQYQRMDGAVKQQLSAVKAQALQSEAAKLPELVPAWKDQAKLEAAKAEISKHYANTYQIDQGELNANADTAFKVATLWKAMQYDKLVASKADKSKTLRTVPPVARPGAAQNQGSAKADKDKELSQRFKKSGSDMDAAALLLHRGFIK